MNTENFQRISVRIDFPVAYIVLTHPPLNVIDIAMMRELSTAIEYLETQPQLSTVVLSGSGRAFSAGVDIPAHRPETIGEMLASFHDVIRRLLHSTKVTVAKVAGACLGGGAELAMVCDLVYTARDASWAFPEIKLACFPPVASAGLSALVGQKRASELILTGRQISGDEALAIGLATRAAAADHLDELVEETLNRLRELSPAALATTKKALRRLDLVQFEQALSNAEQIYRDDLMKTEDAREGIEAWIERRPPAWKAR